MPFRRVAHYCPHACRFVVMLRAPVHEAHALAGAGGGAVAGHVVDQGHLGAGVLQGHHHRDVQLDFRGAGLVGALVHRGQAFVVVVAQHGHDALVEFGVADEVRQAAGGDDRHPRIALPGLDRIAQRAAELDAAAHRRLGRRIEAVHQDRHVRRRVVAHDLAVHEAEGMRRDRRGRLHPDVVRPAHQVGQVEVLALEGLEQVGRQFRMRLVRHRVVRRVHAALGRTVVDFFAAVDRDRRRHVGEDLLLVLAQDDDHVRPGALVGGLHLVQGGAALGGAGAALLDAQQRFEAFVLALAYSSG
jgi:hypothetical protein